MTLYCGIDLHANNSVVAIIDEQDRHQIREAAAEFAGGHLVGAFGVCQ